jgi:hypothetical protein
VPVPSAGLFPSQDIPPTAAQVAQSGYSQGRAWGTTLGLVREHRAGTVSRGSRPAVWKQTRLDTGGIRPLGEHTATTEG